ncbi:MBL fold metallo-hydrolase [Natribacillus halophilus]|uniref:RNA processing exonuclease, beta-lactamase fold, Cft2 family n=1 Tax=Natribacillus halophilus TaxID=549003 RepID=A0A1G8QNZ4_9BACI|nr:MBL fold metallo-hydrolase [Natribacillus halophilus]SDJ06361.1 RNA processing exonuclease, beta-lactamase fold, Cft2 family [Natribacillus halophilus]
MNVTVLGGGNEVGASCLHIEMAETSILIDAGMRMQGEQLLPALGILEELPRPQAILVTHAHADHIGALPVIHKLFPEAPIYATAPTIALMRIMMKDSLKIIEERSRREETIPPYSEEQVEALLAAMLEIPASNTLRIGELRIESHQAGHILGAVMFSLMGGGAELLVTGDLSFKAGRTISGANVPRDLKPDVVVMESTYGNRAHTDRHTEEKRLAEHVAEVIASGGFALVPAFALGRAQEVLLVLQDYMDKGLIPEFPIYVDGLVTPVSRVYRQYPQFLKGNLAHRVYREGDVFLKEGRCQAVHPKEREAILQGKPACIVASSGMLTGGASSWYAEQLIGNDKNAILLTGYQDEESPGKALLDVAEGKTEELTINGTAYEAKARISKYGLSAHADASEMQLFIQQLAPTYTLLVHGDDDARAALSDLLDERYSPTLVENGDSYPFELRDSNKGIKGKRYKPNKEHEALRSLNGQFILYEPEDNDPLKVALCTGVHPKTNVLFSQTLKGKPVKIQPHQLIQALGQSTRTIDDVRASLQPLLDFNRPKLKALQWNHVPAGIYTFHGLLRYVATDDSLEERLVLALALQTLTAEHKREGQTGQKEYKLDDDFIDRAQKGRLSMQGMKMNAAKAMDLAREELSDEPDFTRCGADQSGEKLTLYFAFPDAYTDAQKDKMTTSIADKTGWEVVMSSSTRQDLLFQVLSDLTEDGEPESFSLHLQEKTVRASLPKNNNIQQIAEQFQQRTGFDFQEKDAAATTLSPSKTLFDVTDRSVRMENNEAREETKRWAEDRNIKLYKVSFKEQGNENILEVHFISPEIAKRHETDLEELSYRTGFQVIYAENPKQNEIIKEAVTRIPSSWALKKNPSIHREQSVLGLKVGETPDPDEAKRIEEAIQQVTGYGIELK